MKNIFKVKVLLFKFLFITNLTCLAQTDWELELEKITATDGKISYRLKSDPPTLLDGKSKEVERNFNIKITCPDKNCKDLKAFIDQKDIPASNPQLESITFPITGNIFTDATGTITINLKENFLQRIQINATSPPSSGNPGLKAIDCAKKYNYIGALYDHANNKAIFIVTTNGIVIGRPPEPIDEDDIVEVHVVGLTSTLERLQIERVSEFGLGGFRILGEGEQIKLEGGGSPTPPAPSCAELITQLKDFAPGRARIGMFRSESENKVTLAEFDFAVNPIYRGAFSFGPIFSNLEDNEFGTMIQGNETIITSTSNNPNLHYLIAYTHFLKRRDVEKRYAFKYHINPMVALSLKNTLKNAFAGLSYDILGSSIYITGGIHVSEVKELGNNLKVGDKFSLPADQLPITTKTKGDWFLGLTLDLRAAAKFLSAASSTSLSSR